MTAALLLLAQLSITAGVDVGRVYSIRDGYWLHAMIPTVGISKGPISVDVSAASAYDRLWQDATVTYTRTRGRITFTASSSVTRYSGIGTDVTWLAGLNWKLR